jgi:dihydroorotate dehydrogenase electron transfer subunit
MKWASKMVENTVILSNVNIAKDVYKMELTCSFSSECKPGQFVEIAVPGFFLRRPISISAVEEGKMTIVYKVLGQGTDVLSGMMPGEELNLFGPLGTCFTIADEQDVVLCGGGVGVPPLYETAKAYIQKGITPTIVLGFNNVSDMFYEEAFQKLGCKVYIATMDASFGTKGTVIDAINANGVKVGYIQACGPIPMLRAINNTYEKGQISLESRMACGMGACMGCVVKMSDGSQKRVCKDGPVFDLKEVAL